MADSAIRAPRSQTEAQRLCEQWAALDGEIAAMEEARDAAIAAANAEVDKDLLPLVARRTAIAAKLEPWWKANAAALTQGKRNSAELGGAVLGTRAGRGRVTFTGSIDAVVESLRSTAWGRKFVRTRHELDKGKVADGLRGKAREALESEGLGFEEGGETFYIVRTVQAGTQAKVQR